ncbi:MAG: apolipoprotein N-acyltransferase [Anaerolineae bacterium]|nr:apolipoprotein N-acyltransferase [Phycisphaerae bacterium]
MSDLTFAKPSRWRDLLTRVCLLAISSILLTFSFAPYSQFYLAWIGMVPWLLALRGTRNIYAAIGWGFIGGVIFNAISMTWLIHATLLGTAALVGYTSLFWALAGAIVHATKALEPRRWHPAVAVLLIATVWAGCEWFRGWLFNGFQWMFLGQTQSPILAMCQVADIGGVFAVTFWVMCINALIVITVMHRAPSPRTRGEGWGEGPPVASETRISPDPSPNLSPSTGRGVGLASLFAALIVIFTLLYGLFRISQTQTTPGPRVMVVQPDFAHERGGARTVTWEHQAEYHLAETAKALANEKGVDLVVWSETVLPPMNAEARRRAKDPRLSTGIHDDVLALVRKHATSLVFGAYALVTFDKSEADADIRNATYLYSAFRDDQLRYDKIHLVPYGESVPFKKSIPWLHKLMFQMAAYSVNYLITAGALDDLRIFDLPTADSNAKWRFVTPICFEDIDGRLCSRMFRPTPDAPGVKRAELIINISNDGWFKGNMRRQHFQNAIFRSIENRAPTARADNTGISGFIDSVGRVDQATLMPEDTSGIRVATLAIDPRLTFYTRFGDVFGAACFVISIAACIVMFVRDRRRAALSLQTHL